MRASTKKPCNALVCQAVHLLNAKALDQQIASMCLAQPDPALSPRTVTTCGLRSPK